MYQVAHFRELERAPLHDFVRAHPLGLLITSSGGLLANAVPFLLYDEGERGVLRCHLAKGNPQWQVLAEGAETLVAFQGADHYISPSWYPSKAETHKVVPTWNYTMVQARGPARVIEDAAWLLAHVTALSATHEAQRPEPWALSDAPEAFIASQLKGIVGVEIAISALEGKFKASQNRPMPDRAGVVAGLTEIGGGPALDMAALVKARGGV